LPIFDFRLPPRLYLGDPEIKNRQSKIGNVLMADRPRLPPLDKREATFDKSWDYWRPVRAMFQRVLLATFSNTLSSCLSDAFCPPFSHFDPFGTEFCEPGRVSHQLKRF